MKNSETLYKKIKALTELFSVKVPEEGLEQDYMSSAKEILNLEIKAQYIAFEAEGKNETEKETELKDILEEVEYNFKRIIFRGEKPTEIEFSEESEEFEI